MRVVELNEKQLINLLEIRRNTLDGFYKTTSSRNRAELLIKINELNFLLTFIKSRPKGEKVWKHIVIIRL